MSTFLLSYFLRFYLQLGGELLVVAAHGAFDGFVLNEAFQRLLYRAVVGIAAAGEGVSLSLLIVM